MRSVYHWDILAEDVAEQIKIRLTNVGSEKQAVFVIQSNDSPFGEGFHNMLVTRLTNKGITTLTHKKRDALDVDYKVQVVYHKKAIKLPQVANLAFLSGAVFVIHEATDHHPWSVPARIATAAGIFAAGDIVNNSVPTLIDGRAPNTEIIITTSVVRDDTYLLRKTDCYYTVMEDAWHYDTSQSSKTIKVVDH